MRKSEKKWKSVWESKQLKLYARTHNAPQQQATGGTGEATGEVMDLLSRLTEQHALTEQLLEQIVDYKNLKEAYEQVRRNKDLHEHRELYFKQDELVFFDSWFFIRYNRLARFFIILLCRISCAIILDASHDNRKICCYQ